MSELGQYLAAYYLAHVEADVSQLYVDLIKTPVSANHMARMHLHMWKMALTDETYDLQRVRAWLLRRAVTAADVETIDDHIVRRLGDLIGAYGADRQAALHTEVAMAFAAMTMTGAMRTGAMSVAA